MSPIVALLLVLGALFMLLAAVGLVRLPDLYLRMSATSKAATLGASLVLLGAAVHFGTAAVAGRAVVIVVVPVPDRPGGGPRDRPGRLPAEEPAVEGHDRGRARGRRPRSKGERVNAMTVVLFVAGLGLLVLGAEWLVKGASRLAAALGISPLVIGLTVVAYGTSAPEMAVSVKSAWAGQPDLALGNVVGSNIFNVLFILGASAIITPLVVSSQLIRLDVPIMIGVSAADPPPGRRRLGRAAGRRRSSSRSPSPTRSSRSGRAGRSRPPIREEYGKEYGPKPTARRP